MKIKGYMVKKALHCLKRYGIKEVLVQTIEQLEMNRMPYDAWYRSHRITKEQWEAQRKDTGTWGRQPVVSICVPLYHTPRQYLCEMIDSVVAQSYPNWQLCLADGSADDGVERVIREKYSGESRIRYRHLEKNLGIAENTNAAFALADGEWIALLDHDDVLAEEALYEMLAAAGVNAACASQVMPTGKVPQADVVYSDEDKVSEDLQTYFYPHFKPDYNVDLLRTNNYITHFFMVKREIVEQIGGFRAKYDGAQDYDFILRSIERAAYVAHVPRVLYHWRTSANSTADNPESKQYAYEAGRRVVEDYLLKHGIAAAVTDTRSHGIYRVRYQVEGNPLVTVCVTGSHKGEAPERVLNKSGWTNREVLLLPETTGKEREQLLQSAKGEYLLLLSADMRDASKDWLKELMGHCQRKEVAAAGGKILDRKGRILHAGRIIGLGNMAGSAFAGMRGERYGYMHRADEQMDYSALDGACMLIKTDAFFAAGGFAPELSWEAAILDLCFRLRKPGHLLVYTPYAVMRRGCLYIERQEISGTDKEYLLQCWQEQLVKPDPCYNENLTLAGPGYFLRPEKEKNGILS